MKGKYTALPEWDAIEHIKRYSDSLGELVKLSESMEEEENISETEFDFVYNALTDDICRKCPRYRSCFGERHTETVRELRMMLEKAHIGQCLDGHAASDTFRRTCVYFPSLMEETTWLFRLLYQNRYWKNRFAGMKRMIQKELSSQYRMFKNCTLRMESDISLDRQRKRRLNRRLFWKGCMVSDGRERQGEDGSIEVLLEVQLAAARKASVLTDSLSGVYHRPMVCCRPEEWIPAGRQRLLFTEEGNFHVTFGKRHCSKTGENICGDTFSFLNRNHRQAVMCLSDGMGTGERAYESSSRLIETFETMLMAGVSQENAMELLHATLCLQAGKELSTLDTVSVSLRTGMARFMKAGGAATFIRHHHTVERICQESIPLGYLDHTDYRSQYKKMYDGDMIIMLSDGMLASKGSEDPLRYMETVLAGIETGNAQSVADQLIAAIPQSSDGYDDDRTVLVAAVWEKGHRKHVAKH